MVIDSRVIEGVRNEDGSYNEQRLATLLSQIIFLRNEKCVKYDKMLRYYKGRHDILDRARKSRGAANNRLAANFPKYITKMTTAFIVGNPIAYNAPDGTDISALADRYKRNDMSTVDAELEKSMSIYGKAYELVYADEDSLPRSCIADVRSAFVCYTDTATYTPIFGVHYLKRYDILGQCIGIVCKVYTDSEIITFENSVDDWGTMRISGIEPHYFGIVPLIEYRNNKEEMGDFEDVIPLVDAYNVLQSDRLNDKEQFVDSFLFLRNCEIDSEQARKLREEKILMGEDGATAAYLSKVLSENDTEILRGSLREDILMFSMVPDMSDEHFGTQQTGVAMRYKLLAIKQNVADKERYFTKGLRRRLEAYNEYLSIKGTMAKIDTELIDIVFTLNIPTNALETAQIIAGLQDIVSDRTLISQLDFITDADAEIEAVKRQREETETIRAEANERYAAGGGF